MILILKYTNLKEQKLAFFVVAAFQLAKISLINTFFYFIFLPLKFTFKKFFESIKLMKIKIDFISRNFAYAFTACVSLKLISSKQRWVTGFFHKTGLFEKSPELRAQGQLKSISKCS